ncbi:MAG: UbiA-like polyprenyltransferase [Candidatus Methylacidiphilales bacterium]|nr:UbiA-like polyprenyltransferase [Candidatus Methylacidiphilales bacterium]
MHASNQAQAEAEAAPSEPVWLRFGRFIRLSHTVFALPFALVSMLVAARGLPPWPVVGWILLCMVSARTAAMLFNRLADWDIDQLNPRTQDRHRLVPKPLARAAWVVSVAVFVLGAWQLNLLCLVLAPVAIGIISFYSLCKRFTAYAHLFLGLALAVAPMGAWAAVSGELWSPAPYLLAMGVLCWVFGFDLIYATLDMEFDRKAGLHSFPARYGLTAALRLAVGLHGMAAVLFLVFGWWAGFGWIYLVAWLACVVALVYEHRLSRQGDPTSINRAFFAVNAVVGLLLLSGTALDVFF